MLGRREARGATALVAWLRERGVDARTEEFRGYSTFAQAVRRCCSAPRSPAGCCSARAPRARRAGDALALGSAIAADARGDLRLTPALRRPRHAQPSVNVVGRVPAARPDAPARLPRAATSTPLAPGSSSIRAVVRAPRDSSCRSRPSRRWLLAAGPLLRRLPGRPRAPRGGARAAWRSRSLALAERELRGEDVPGASDNASGAAVALQLAAECAASPLEHTEVDVLITSCEESGLLGAQAYARRHKLRAAETTFLNFDTVGGDAPLTYILREGSATVSRPATERLVALLEEIAQRRPDLGLVPAATTPGLPTDATPMRARGWEAITLLAQGETIPNYHWPTDTYENVASAHRRARARNRARAAARARRRGPSAAA